MTLLELQRRVAGVIMTPLNVRPERREAEALIKPNRRLTSQARADIYRRSYWSRILDSLRDDFPGLCAVLGPRAFHRLAQAYLSDVPSQSYTMRDLGLRLEQWLRNHPAFGGEKLDLALDMLRLEWAHIEAFDKASKKPLGPEDLLEVGPELTFSLQPHVTLLDLQYPVDDLRIGVQNSTAFRRRQRSLVRAHKALEPRPTFLAVHRVGFKVYYRPLAEGEYRILSALRQGHPLGEAVGVAGESGQMIGTWFESWSRLGWLCHPSGKEV